ncbi:MAG: putative glycolipid-binding domain-containing protein [Actinomycetes bacterium]
MSFIAPPAAAAFQHRDARSGFEVVYFHPLHDGCRIQGCTAAVEDGQIWAVDYEIRVDTTWTTRSARISGRSASGSRSTMLEADGAGHWLVDGEIAPHLDGCLDVDLESSAMTNALPVHRMDLPVGGRVAAPAAYVRALDLAVERLEQTYVRTTDETSHQRYDYTAPAFEFTCRLVYDESGLVLDYPGLAVRAA